MSSLSNPGIKVSANYSDNDTRRYGMIYSEKDAAVKINDAINKTTTQPVDVKGKQTGNTEAAGTGAAKSSATPASTGGTSSVNVNLSSQLQSVMGQIADTKVFDAQKVDEIKAAISSGQFQIDTGKVADGLLNTVKDLLHRPRE